MSLAGLVVLQATVSLLLRSGYVLTFFTDVVQSLLLLIGTLSFCGVALRHQGRSRVFAAFFAYGLTFWLVYQLLWTYIEVILRNEVPDPFSGDVILFLHLVPMIGAVALQPQVEQDGRTTRLGKVDFALLLTWWLYLYLFSVIPWQYVHTDVGFYDHNYNLIYMAEKVALLAGLLFMGLSSSGTWKTICYHLFGATLLYALSSHAANWAIANSTFFTGSSYDVPLTGSMAWIAGVGAIAADLCPKSQPRPQSAGKSPWMTRLSMAAVFSLPVFAAYAFFAPTVPSSVRTFRIAITLACMMIMGGLVILKQHWMDSELMALLAASQKSYEGLKQVQAQLVQSEKLASLGQLLGGAAHELNNPLAAMLGYSELLCATPLNDEQRALTHKIAQQVCRTKALVDSLLSFAKQLPGEKALLNLNAPIQTALRLSASQLKKHNIEVESQLATDLPLVLGDSNQLLQVFLQLLSNAVQALKEKGETLQISTRREGELVVAEFVDNGPGATEPERVFDPFYTTRPVGQGPGMGLSACYGIVREHHGRITCRNQPEGGAVLRIELPGQDSAPSDPK